MGQTDGPTADSCFTPARNKTCAFRFRSQKAQQAYAIFGRPIVAINK